MNGAGNMDEEDAPLSGGDPFSGASRPQADADPARPDADGLTRGGDGQEPFPPWNQAEDFGKPLRSFGIALLVGGVLCILFVAYYVLTSAERLRQEPLAAQSAETSGSLVAEPAADVARLEEKIASLEGMLREATAAREQSQAQGRVRAAALASRGEEIREELRTLRAELAAWKALFPPLMTNDDGRRIAASPAHVALVADLAAADRVTESDAATFEEQLGTLLDPVTRARHDGTNVIGEQHAEALESLARDVRTSLDALRQDRALVKAVVAETRDAAPAESTLEDALAARRAEEAAALARRRLDARKAALEETARELEEAERRRVAAETEIKRQQLANETARLEAEAAGLRDVGAAEAEAAAAAREKQKRLAAMQAAMPEIESLLRPFITEGYTQPQGREFRRTTRKAKVSFSALRASGMLDDNIDSVRMLFNGMVPNRLNDRELGGFPAMNSRGDWLGKVARAQELLREFGPLLVEQGLLEP